MKSYREKQLERALRRLAALWTPAFQFMYNDSVCMSYFRAFGEPLRVTVGDVKRAHKLLTAKKGTKHA